MFTLNWGVIGIGQFASTWINDVFEYYEKDPSASDVKHVLRAVASTSSLEKARTFADKLKVKPSKVYASYDDLLKDKTVDIIYIASPIGVHFKQALQALLHGKHVLCEKTFVVTMSQAAYLQILATEVNLFIMEALWTRFLPSTLKVQKLVHQEKILGDITRVTADLSHDMPYDPSNRMYQPQLAGGASYDMLIYALVWPAIILMDKTPYNPRIVCSALKVKQAPELDLSVNVSLVFEELDAIANSSSSMRMESPGFPVRIEGTKGYLELDRASRPGKARLFLGESRQVQELDLEFPGKGYYFEANAVADAIKHKQLSTALHPLRNTIRMMKIFDAVRDQCNIQFPPELTSVEQS